MTPKPITFEEAALAAVEAAMDKEFWTTPNEWRERALEAEAQLQRALEAIRDVIETEETLKRGLNVLELRTLKGLLSSPPTDDAKGGGR